MVKVTLNISRDMTPNPVPTLVGTAAVSGVPRTMAIYQNGNRLLAYVCSDSAINIVDVTDPAAPAMLRTFANSDLTTENGATVPGFQVMGCAIYNDNLIVSYSRYNGNTSAKPIPTHFATFSLADPTNPLEVGGAIDIQRGDSAGLYIAGNTALMYQSTALYDPDSNVILHETDDIWTADLTRSAASGAVVFLNDLHSCGGTNPNTKPCNNSAIVRAAAYRDGACTSTAARGKPYRIGLGAAVNAATTYFASTGNPGCPQTPGQLLVVDTSKPSSPTILNSIAAPGMAFMMGIAVQGNIAVAVGDSTGIRDIHSGYAGTLVISSFDIGDPQNPVLLDSITTQLSDKAGASIVSLGMNTFAVGNTTLNGNAELVLVDALNPNALRYIPYNASSAASPAIAHNGYFFALSATPASTTNSLSAFQLSEIAGPQLTVKLNLPNSGRIAVDPASFSLPPSSVSNGPGDSIYEWRQPASNTIAFNMNVAGVKPGEAPIVVTGGEMEYTQPSLGAGTYVFPPLAAISQQILNISPTSQSVSNAGNSATYIVTITNTTNTVQTYVPFFTGISPAWGVALPASVTVPPNSNKNYNFVLTTPFNAVPATYNFTVTVNTEGGIMGSAPASLTIENPGPLSPCDVNQDGMTTVSDVQALINEALGVLMPNDDLNQDGVVNVVDLQIDINAVLSLGCSAT